MHGEAAQQNHISKTAPRYCSIFCAARVKAWTEHSIPRLGAALAFYTIFAIAPLFIIVLAVAGFFFGEDAAQHQLFRELNGLIGCAKKRRSHRGSHRLRQSTQNRHVGYRHCRHRNFICRRHRRVFVQLQDSLNTIWNVRPKPGRGLRHFIRNRVLSFAMILVLGFLLLVSLVLSAVLAAVGQSIGGAMTSHELVLRAVNFVLSLGAVSLLFALIFKLLPDVKIAWRDVWLERSHHRHPVQSGEIRAGAVSGPEHLCLRLRCGRFARYLSRVGILLVTDTILWRGIHAALCHPHRAQR